jgi:TetR/AcrR family transcriptional regulator
VPPTTKKTSKSGTRSWTRGPANSDALLAAARRLVLERGENFTTHDLVKEADVALQTFYRHFGGKDQLLLAVVADLIQEHCISMEAHAESIEDPVERLHFYVTATLTGVVGKPEARSGARFMTSQHWRLHQLFPAELAEANRPFADLLQRELEAGTAAGSLSSTDPERDAWIINKLVMTVFHHYAFVDDDPAVDSIGEDIWRFCLDSVARPNASASSPRKARRPARAQPAGSNST